MTTRDCEDTDHRYKCNSRKITNSVLLWMHIREKKYLISESLPHHHSLRLLHNNRHVVKDSYTAVHSESQTCDLEVKKKSLQIGPRLLVVITSISAEASFSFVLINNTINVHLSCNLRASSWLLCNSAHWSPVIGPKVSVCTAGSKLMAGTDC